jgi:hypothetical protein
MPMLPSSLMLLNTAHEYLGRRSWCCNSDGAMLRFYVSNPQLVHYQVGLAGWGGRGKVMLAPLDLLGLSSSGGTTVLL